MKRWLLILPVLLGASVSWADTVFLANNSTLNGRVGYEDGRFNLVARFWEEQEPSRQPLFFAPKAVTKVEFNDNNLNRGQRDAVLSPLARFGLLAPVDEPPNPGTAPPLLPVRVVKSDGPPRQFQLVSISKNEVRLIDDAGREETLKRSEVRSVSPDR